MTDVIVWGPDYFYTDVYGGSGGGGVGDEHDGPDLNPTLHPGGGGGGPQTQAEPFTSICPTQDSAARKVADKIMSIPSSFSQEWTAALTSRSSGYGVSNQALYSDGTADRAGVRALSSDIPYIVGTVHNHQAYERTASAAVDRYPSDADWQGTETLLTNEFSVNPDTFVIYIVDHEGEVRGFPYRLRDTFPRDNDENSKNESVNLPPALPPAHECIG